MESTADLLTLRDIARECGVRFHQVKYAISEYGIEPRQRAGIIRLYSRDDIPTVKAALERIAERRRGVQHA